ncbi:MAG: hypothetical protein Q8R88_10720 [Desulfoprunum sp.]|nr:hypothetical protein [Desulfoprunum sp.]
MGSAVHIYDNLEAFCRCLSDIGLSDVVLIVTPEDSIGYGPQPEEVLKSHV